MEWKYKRLTPAGGKVYHKKDSIMVVYDNKIRLYRNVPKDSFVPAMAEYFIERDGKGSVVVKN